MSQPDALRLNLTDEEAKSEVRSYDVLPTGSYLCNIVEITHQEVKPGKKNTGKPYWNILFVVDEGDYAGRRIYSNVMLFEGALYSIKQLQKPEPPVCVLTAATGGSEKTIRCKSG